MFRTFRDLRCARIPDEKRASEAKPWIAGTDQQVGASFEQDEGATGPMLARYLRSARTPASLGTLFKTRSGVGGMMWRDEARRGRAGQAFKLGEPGVVDGTTADSLAASYRGPRQDGQVAKTKFLARNCLRILDQGLGPTRAHSRTNRPLEKSPARWPGLLKGGLDFPSTHARLQLTSHQTPVPDVDAPRLVTHWAIRGSGSESLSLIR